ncbi:MAG: hypothetical protein ACKVH1_12030 [Alphaproteobacteria bacterium]
MVVGIPEINQFIVNCSLTPVIDSQRRGNDADSSYASAADAATHTHTLLDRLSPHILGGLTVEQRAAIAAASGGWKAAAHRVNLRLRLPLLPKRWYFTVLGGPERRTAARRSIERVRNPVRTAGNMAFIVVTAMTFCGVAAAALLFSSSVFEY